MTPCVYGKLPHDLQILQCRLKCHSHESGWEPC